ncbi:MAG: AMP-binding protein [bacterium]|nr:AMP-binding protein [bacterium]
MSLNKLFLSTFSRYPSRVAFQFEGREITFGEIEKRAGEVAASLLTLRVEPGSRVAVLLPNGPDLIFAHLGINFAGAVRIPLNPAYGERELNHIFEDSEAEIIFTHPEYVPRLKKLRVFPREIIAVGEENWVRIGGRGIGDFLVAGDTFCDEEVKDSELAMIAYTSGTTGLSKGAMITHGNLRSNIETLIKFWGWTENEKLLLTLPLFHIHGLGLGIHGVMATGCSCILKPKFDPEEVLNILNRGEATLFMGVPTMYHRLAEIENPSRFDLSRVRLFISGSAALSPALFQKFEELYGHKILERYGLTETIMNTSNPLDGIRKPGSVGLPLPGIEVRIIGEKGNYLKAGKTGEVAVKGPNIFKGYLNQPDATEKAFVKKYFRTGDLGFFDEEGYLHLSGRKSELIISGGYNVYPREVEDVINTHPKVQEAAVAGISDPELGEKVWAFIVPRGQESIEVSELKAFLQGQIAGYKIPKGVTLVSELPRNAMGKVMKNQMKPVSGL